jgi:hypothetical protein
MLKFSLLIFLAAATISLSAQTNEEIALVKGREAIKLMKSGKVDESIVLLEEAQKLDPKRFDYPYELALAYYYKEDYPRAAKMLEELKGHKDVEDLLFQLLGNSYSILRDTTKAFAAYNEGLARFPNSGRLYLEKGNVYLNHKEYSKAIPLYEKGIEKDPSYPSNYYRAAKLFLSSTDEVWGLIYGEIFINLERNTDRTAEMSKLLFDTYKSEIHFSGDTSVKAGFCQTIIDASSLDGKNFKLPFCMIFETTMAISPIGEKSITLSSLNRIRNSFISNYFKSKHDKGYYNPLFTYLKKMSDAGHIEAYNHWILMKGDEDEFETWYASNEQKWKAFVEWFSTNELTLDASNKFVRGQN